MLFKVVNVISDIGHGAQKVARKAAKGAEPIIRGSAALWRKTVDEHIVPNVNEGLDFMGEKAVESVDMLGMILIQNLDKVKSKTFYEVQH